MRPAAAANLSACVRTLVGHRPRAAAAAGVLAVWAGVSAWLVLDFSSRIRDWSVMTDELLYVKLATAIADTHSPLPQVHGTTVAVLNQLYPLLLAPLFGGLDVPTAFHAAHVFNAPLMASASVPAYLIARKVVSRPWSLAVAVLSATAPWMVLTGVLMTEPLAYPAFLWAVLACLHAMGAPSRRSDLLAVGGLVLAVLARTQFITLALVFPVALLADALAPPRGPSTGGAAVTVLRRHSVLVAAYAAAGALAGAVAVAGSLGDALGVYSTTLHGSILPSNVWQASAAHLDAVAVGCGLVPLLLGGGWILAAATRPREREPYRFAVLALPTIAALTVETASFDVRFGGDTVVRDRYLFYVVPLLLAGTAAALADERARRPAVGAAVLTALFAATVHWLDFPTNWPAFWVDSPAHVLNATLADQSGPLGTASFVAVAGTCVGAVLVGGLLALPRRLLGVLVLAFLLPFTVLTTRKQLDTVASGTGSSGRLIAGPPSVVLDWVDSILPTGGKAAMIPFPQAPDFAPNAVLWWDVEFWNSTVGQTFLAADGHFSYAPFPDRRLVADWKSGRIPEAADSPPFVVFAVNDPRFRLAGVRHAENIGLRVLLADRPYRLLWMTRGLDTDGWARPGRPVTLRVYSQRNAPELVEVAVTMTAPPGAPARYVASAVGSRRGGEVAAGTQQFTVEVCVPAASFADVALRSWSAARIPNPPLGFRIEGTRRVGVRVGPIETGYSGRSCSS